MFVDAVVCTLLYLFCIWEMCLSSSNSIMLLLVQLQAILMRRGLDNDGPGGLFTLRISSQGQQQSEISYIIAFEDHVDANNFCCLLESFFEDLGDFSADIVPLSVKVNILT